MKRYGAPCVVVGWGYIIALVMSFGCDRPVVTNLGRQPEGPIVCFGDSLTEGFGASAPESYPAVLERLLGQRVVNTGQSGGTTEDGLRRVARDIVPLKPSITVVEFGANDILSGVPKATTLANLEAIVERVQGAGSVVVLLDVPVRLGFAGHSYRPEYEALARRKGAVLVPDWIAGIYSDPALTSDALHPNAAGYGVMAARVAEALKPLLRGPSR